VGEVLESGLHVVYEKLLCSLSSEAPGLRQPKIGELQSYINCGSISGISELVFVAKDLSSLLM
jgi:hypothetical protein